MTARWATIVFARPPRPGQVKTRLIPALGEEASTALYQCLLSDTIVEMLRLRGVGPPLTVEQQLPVHLLLAWDKPPAPEDLSLLPGKTLPAFLQEGASLGERLLVAFRAAFARGFARVAVIGSDQPLLEAEEVYRALQLLDEADVALGPCDDGGYYLIAAKQAHPELFAEVEWGSSKVLAQTLARAAGAGLVTVQLKSGYDVDSLADLQRLKTELTSGERERIPCPRTFEFVMDWQDANRSHHPGAE